MMTSSLLAHDYSLQPLLFRFRAGYASVVGGAMPLSPYDSLFAFEGPSANFDDFLWFYD